MDLNLELNFQPVYCVGTKDGIGVIEALESFGGKNVHEYSGIGDDYLFYISTDNTIRACATDTEIYRHLKVFYEVIEPVQGFKAKHGEKYYFIGGMLHNLFVDKKNDVDCMVDVERFDCGNYFKTREEAEDAMEKLKQELKKIQNDNLKQNRVDKNVMIM